MTEQEIEGWPKGEKDLGVFNRKELVALCQSNDWLKTGGVMFKEDPFAESDYKFNFMSYPDLAELKKFFRFGNWAIRCGAIHKNLCFVQQDNGGDEWWTIKKFEDGSLIAFESISWRHIIKDTEKFKVMPLEERKKYEDSWSRETVLEKIDNPFEKDVARLLVATKEQCEKCDW